MNDQAPTVWLILAMSYHKLGNAPESRRALDAARAWMRQSVQEERLAYRVSQVIGLAAGPGDGFVAVGALGLFAGMPLAEIGKGNTGVRRWRDIPWPEQLALEILRSEAEMLIQKNPVKP